MTFRELSFKLSKLISEHTDKFDATIVVHETILGFMHHIEDVTLVEEPETKEQVIAIQYRGE